MKRTRTTQNPARPAEDPRPHPERSFRGGRRRGATAFGALAATACLALAATLAGCGGSDTNGLEGTPAADLDDRVVEALRGADSVHVVDTVEPGGRSGFSYDVRLTAKSSTGTIVRDGHQHEMIRIDADTYVRGDDAYWQYVGEGEAAALLADKWVKLSESGSKLYEAYTLDGVAQGLAQYTASLDDPVTQAKLADSPVVTATAPDGSTLWAANTGAAYPLKVELSGADSGTIEFSEYGADLEVTPPPDFIDLARLG